MEPLLSLRHVYVLNMPENIKKTASLPEPHRLQLQRFGSSPQAQTLSWLHGVACWPPVPGKANKTIEAQGNYVLHEKKLAVATAVALKVWKTSSNKERSIMINDTNQFGLILPMFPLSSPAVVQLWLPLAMRRMPSETGPMKRSPCTYATPRLSFHKS